MRHSLHRLLLPALLLLLAAGCVKHEYYNRSVATDSLGSDPGGTVPCDTCGGADPVQGLRWLALLAADYATDTVNHLAVYRCRTVGDAERLLVAVASSYPFDSAWVYTCQGERVDSMPMVAEAFAGHGLRYSTLWCVHQNYAHRGGGGPCDVADPLRDMPWLRHFVELHTAYSQVACELYACQYEHAGIRHDGFCIDPCTNCTDRVTELYDCLGNLLCTFGQEGGQEAGYTVDSLSLVLLFETP